MAITSKNRKNRKKIVEAVGAVETVEKRKKCDGKEEKGANGQVEREIERMWKEEMRGKAGEKRVWIVKKKGKEMNEIFVFYRGER